MPPHFHVKHREGDWEIRVFFLDCTDGELSYEYKVPSTYTVEKHPLKAGFQKEILEKIKALNEMENEQMKRSYQDILYEEWGRKVKIEDKFRQ